MLLFGAGGQAAIGMGFIPGRWSGLGAIGPSVPASLTPLSATLVHGDVLHLALNLLMLLWAGLAVERILGRGALLLLYIAGAFAAALAIWLAAPQQMLPSIGASGAISAVIGAFSLTLQRQKAIVRSPRLNRWLNAAWLLAAWVVLQLMMGWLAQTQGVLLSTAGHIGGFVAGLLLQRPLLMWRYRKA